MKKLSLALLSFIFLFSSSTLHAEDSSIRKFHSTGQVITVDPVYSQITIEHGAIKDFAGPGQTEFYVASAELLNGLSRNDLVTFDLVDTKGDVKIEKISKTGVAPEKTEGMPLGQAVQETLEGAGELAKGLTEPIKPAHQVVEGAVDTTTGATDTVLKDAKPEQKTTF